MTADGWRRLSPRLVWVGLIRAATASVPGYLGLVALGDDGPVWPLVAASVAGLLRVLADLVRLLTTRYRVLPDRVELHSGWVARRRRTVARDRIRSVDTSAKLLHRPFGLRVVHVGTGERDSSFALDALGRADAARLQDSLLTRTEPEPEPVASPGRPAIARFRPAWVLFNAVRVWAVLGAAGPVLGLYWFLRALGIDLFGDARAVYDSLGAGPVWTVVLCAAVAYPVGIVLQAGAFVAENWRFTLYRDGGTLVTRRGLFDTQTVQRDVDRVRGAGLKEPLVWRPLGLAESVLITTGLRTAGSSTLVPRLPRREALGVAARVLADGHRPLEAPPRRHPRGALTRLLIRAVAGPAIVSGVLLGFGLSGAVPDRWWPLPLPLLPLTLPLAVAAYRSLGHTTAGPYVVLRRGAINRHTTALRGDAVIGWTIRQSLFQRWGRRVSIGVATAAGERFYQTHDLGTDQALTLIREATPSLAAQLSPTAPTPDVPAPGAPAPDAPAPDRLSGPVPVSAPGPASEVAVASTADRLAGPDPEPPAARVAGRPTG